MMFVYARASHLIAHNHVSNGECAALVQWYIPRLDASHGGPASQSWKPGINVWENSWLPIGTAIATFFHGKYQDKAAWGTAHAGFYVGRSADGIYIVHQFHNQNKIRWTLVPAGLKPGLQNYGVSGSVYNRKAAWTYEDLAEHYFTIDHR